MKTNESHPGQGGRSCVWSSEDGRVVLGLSEMVWETNFFGKRFGRLEIDAEEKEGCEPQDLEKALKDTLSFGDQNGFDIIEARLYITWIHHMHIFESNAFRLVDTKMRFTTWMPKAGMKGPPAPEGELGFATPDMKEEILRLTHSAFTHNPSFKSRFNNERFFTRSDAERYYEARIENSLGDPDTIFAVMRDEGNLVGYMAYTKTGEHKGQPLYKATLAAVASEYRGRGAYFSLGSFVYRHLPESGAYLDLDTQLSNLSTIRNLIKAERNLESIELVFYRPKGGRA